MSRYSRWVRAGVGTLAVLTSALTEAHASIAPDAQVVLQRFLEATGGAAAFRNERAVHTKGTLSAFGLSGAIEAWTERPDRTASVTSIGPFTLRDGYEGTTAWRVDQNGKFLRRDGKELDDAKASAYFENDLWLTPDQGGGVVTLLGAETDSAGTYTVLEVKPPVGRPRRIWFAQATGLLDRVVLEEDQTIISRFSDYRTVAGRKRPHHTVVSVVGMPANEARITLDSIWVNQEFGTTVFAPPVEAASDVRFLEPGTPARLPFRYGERHVWLQASVNGRPAESVLLDTGASITVIDSAYAVACSLKRQGRLEVAGAGAAGGASFTQVDSLRVAGPGGDGVVLTGQKVAILSLNPYLEPFFWRPVAAVLGYDFISRFVVEIDYDRGVLVLHDPKTFRYRGRGAAIPMTMAGNIPVIRATLDGIEGAFRLDVGSGGTVDLHRPFVERHDLTRKVGKTLQVMGAGFGGTFTSRLCRMKRMEIGPFGWNDPLVSLSDATTGGFNSQDFAGNIGNQVLERFTCTFDYEHRVVHLEPGRRYADPDRFSLAGVQLARFGDTIRAMQVLPGSAAEAAGIQANDEIVSIAGRPIASYTPDRLTEMFERGAPGEQHVIRLRRDGRTRKVTLRLKALL